MSSIFVFAFSFFLLFDFVSLWSFGNAKNYDDRPLSKLSQKYSTRDIIKDNSSAIQAPEFDEETQNSSQYHFLFNLGILRQSFGYYTLSNNIGANNIGARMSYFFFKSRKNQSDPVVIWLNGGPGVSSTVGLFYENGPYSIASDFSLAVNKYGWDEVSNILYVDQPIGTGLSFDHSPSEIRDNYRDITNDLYDFLQIFFRDYYRGYHYRNNDFYITGQSYAGHYAPALASLILDKNMQGYDIINLKGVAIGNAITDMGIQYPLIPIYAYENGLISKEQCDYTGNSVGLMCQTALLTCAHDPNQCRVAQSTCEKLLDDTLSQINMNRNFSGFPDDINMYHIWQSMTNRPNYEYERMIRFFNHSTVKSELGLPENREFEVYNKRVFAASTADWAMSTHQMIARLLNDGIKFLSYVGKLDLVFNHLGTYQAVMSLSWQNQNRTEFTNLKLTPVDFGNDTVGSIIQYGPLTYFEVLNAGNNVPADQPATALTMISHWLQGNF